MWLLLLLRLLTVVVIGAVHCRSYDRGRTLVHPMASKDYRACVIQVVSGVHDREGKGVAEKRVGYKLLEERE